ncbi:hypothetical protein SD70_21045 [Gordoniibacillus kamchatkensis]|uniref:Uncharacterized protein n=1 Tax=Gordoniibacillus kamchatkensis TaxID=1590651 RepID=A0ABR5AE54_9BACL|nr:hypothetical protein SD70_21045 [Paenibacillus sp. VKM B-2647]
MKWMKPIDKPGENRFLKAYMTIPLHNVGLNLRQHLNQNAGLMVIMLAAIYINQQFINQPSARINAMMQIIGGDHQTLVLFQPLFTHICCLTFIVK